MKHIEVVSDADALAALREAAAVAPPSPFATARAGRSLEAALDDALADALADELRTRTRWTTGRVAAVALVAAASTGALALFAVLSASGALRFSPREGAAPAGAIASASHAHVDNASAAGDERARLTVPAGVESTSAGLWVESPAPTLSEPVRRARRTVADEAERLVEAGDPEGGARLLVRALDGGSRDNASAFASLALLARRFPEAILSVDAALAGVHSADAMGLRCQHRLLHARDVSAMRACRAFAQEHPQVPAARVLSFAAGRLAEDLGELGWAEEEYSRSLLLSPFSGLSGTDALLARARVRSAMGDVGEASADLRLYLHSEPTARREPAVAALASALGL